MLFMYVQDEKDCQSYKKKLDYAQLTKMKIKRVSQK